MKIKTNKWIVVLLLLMVWGGLAVGQEAAPAKADDTKPSPYTLRQLIQLTKTHNLLIKIGDMDHDIARAEYRDNRALPNPELEFASGKGAEPGESGKASIWEISGQWSLPNPLYRHFLLGALKTHIKEAEIHAEINRRTIIKNLKTHFYKLQFYTKIKTFWEENLQRLEEIDKITRAKVSIGEAKEIDHLRSSVEIQKNKTNLFRIHSFIAAEKIKVNEFLNYMLPEDFTVSEDFTFTPLPGLESRIDRIITASPLIRLKVNQVKRETAGVKAAASSIIEEFRIFGVREKEVEGKKWKVGIGVTVPLFNWKSAQVKKAKLQKEKAQLEYEHERKHFYADIQRMMAEIRVLEKEVDTFTGAVLKEGRENMALSETLYREGEIPLVVFLDSQTSFYEIQERFYEAITQWNILKAELEELIGEEI